MPRGNPSPGPDNHRPPVSSLGPIYSAGNAFSRKLANLKVSVALHYAHYNFVRVRRTLRCTPAMEVGVANQLWSVGQLIEAAEAEEGIEA